MNCADCNTIYQASGKYVPSFCNACCTNRKKDIVEIILPDSVIQYQDIKIAEEALSKLSANIRLDLHNVLDTIDVDAKLKYNMEDCCCISFVGQTSQISIQARNEIISRIKSRQIAFGELVFKRGNRRNPTLAHQFTAAGSKAWFNQHIKYTWTNNRPIFADDSNDHVDSVYYLLPHIDCILINNNKQFKQLFVQ